MAKPAANSSLREQPQISEAEMGLKISNRQLLERFIVEGDNAAFDGLVERFGGVVWRVCRRLLQQEQDAEDAFQAVFLTLARKAPSIRNREGVGSWLYGVAFRTARKARQAVWHRRELTAKAQLPRGLSRRPVTRQRCRKCNGCWTKRSCASPINTACRSSSVAWKG